ncbi:hypothetical protein HYN48_00445 [Flavobacterium magnum]|uniref:Uncharacterized protein n=1 Tax=Flavobacterium magnum TaxID=2162713 RepID=A0A2S0RAI6_9FLAO|nr:T9SS type A sorting domain-containing protein [Flavobacterium magnum]AWA28673.1 hypothetical protein HYN48_00445 [Flavobacterium magnum]
MKKIYLLLLLMSGILQAQIVDVPDAGFKNYLLTANCIDSDNNGTFDTDADLDNDGEIQQTEAASAFRLSIDGAAIQSLQGVESFANISSLSITNTSITQLQLSGLMSLQSITGIGSNLSINEVAVSGLPALTGLTITGSPTLQSLSITNCAAFTSINCVNNPQLGLLDVAGSHALAAIDLEQNHFKTIDLSPCNAITNFVVKDTNLEVLIVKNGHTESPIVFSTISATDIPNLTYVCADNSEMANFQAAIDLIMTNETLPDFNSYPVVGSYCTFTPGGNYNTLTGHVTYDIDGNGCGDSDPDQGYIRLNITNGSNQYAAFTFPDGSYADYFGQGTFAIAPALDNPSMFTVTPAAANVVFPNANNNVTTQDFCITANGSHQDVEIVIAPIVPAKPGFDAKYVIGYRNIGNQPLSMANGIGLEFNDDVLDFVSSSETVSTQSDNLLQWDYQDLLPFESRAITVTFSVNAPTDTPAVNIDDLLPFTATIAANGTDENPADNSFTYTQTVVGSFDPNDISCLEGDSVDPSEIGEYLHYVVNFENTGTAPAENIVVKLQIDPAKFNISSLRIMQASHVLDARLTNNILELIFRNIQLDTGGHGNILLKIRSNGDLGTGDAVSKSAGIYFDYNFPIQTNTATTVFEVLSAGDTTMDNVVTIYPNPAADKMYIDAPGEIKSAELFDAQGRLLLVKTPGEPNAALDISTYTSGVYYIRVTTQKGTKTAKVIKR